VGIGTTSIDTWAKLKVTGTAGAQNGAKQALYVTSPTATANEGVGMRFSAASGSHEAVGIIGMVNNASGNSGSMTFHTYNGGGTIPEQMRITNAGQVGIGATTLNNKFVVLDSGTEVDSGSNASNLTAVFQKSASAGTDCGVSIASGTTGNARLYLGDNGNVTVGGLDYDNNDNSLAFLANSAERMRINSNGNIGIGESTPIRKFQVTGPSGNGSTMLLHMDADTAGGTTALEFKADSTNDNRRVKAAIIFKRDDPGTRGTGHLHFCVEGANSDLNVSTSHSRMVIAPTGRMGINHTTPEARLEIDGGGETGLKVTSTNSGETTAIFQSASNGAVSIADFRNSDGTQVLRVMANNIMEKGPFSASGGNTGTKFINGEMHSSYNGAAPRKQIYIYNPNGEVGSVESSFTSCNFNTSSDYRLKENVDYTWDATTRLKQLKPARFNFIAHAERTVDGFLAHEAATVIPEAVSGTKDAMKDEEYEITPAVMDGETVVTEAVMGTRSVPDMQAIDHSKLVPLLVKTIQELEARITTLENA